MQKAPVYYAKKTLWKSPGPLSCHQSVFGLADCLSRPSLGPHQATEQKHPEKHEGRTEEFAATKAKTLTEIEELSKFVDQQEKLVEQVDEDFSNLATANTEALSDAEMLSSANEIEAKIKAAKRNIANLQEKVQTLKDNLDPDLNAWFQGASKNVVNKASFLLEELDQLTIAIESGRKDLVREVVVVLQEAGSRSILSSIALLRGLW